MHCDMREKPYLFAVFVMGSLCIGFRMVGISILARSLRVARIFRWTSNEDMSQAFLFTHKHKKMRQFNVFDPCR